MSGYGDRAAWADIAAGKSPKKPRAKPGEVEHQIQCAFIELVRIKQNQIPELADLYAIPNGGHRHPAVAAKLKAEGVLSGVPDLCLPHARGGWHALYLETKRPGGSLSPTQKKRYWALMRAGNLVKVCDSVEKLWNATEDYLARPKPEPVELGEAA